MDASSRNPVDEAPINLDEVDLLNINLTEDDWVLTAECQDDRIKYLFDVLSRTPSDSEEKEIHARYS